MNENYGSRSRGGSFLKKMFFFTGIVTFIAVIASIVARLLKDGSADDNDDEFFLDGFDEDEPDECGYAHDKDFEKE